MCLGVTAPLKDTNEAVINFKNLTEFLQWWTRDIKGFQIQRTGEKISPINEIGCPVCF